MYASVVLDEFCTNSERRITFYLSSASILPFLNVHPSSTNCIWITKDTSFDNLVPGIFSSPLKPWSSSQSSWFKCAAVYSVWLLQALLKQHLLAYLQTDRDSPNGFIHCTAVLSFVRSYWFQFCYISQFHQSVPSVSSLRHIFQISEGITVNIYTLGSVNWCILLIFTHSEVEDRRKIANLINSFNFRSLLLFGTTG